MAGTRKQGMAKRTSRRRKPVEGMLTGQLLIAMPTMNTAHFSQTVIYLCAHTSEGAMGIVLNRPTGKPQFRRSLGSARRAASAAYASH